MPLRPLNVPGRPLLINVYKCGRCVRRIGYHANVVAQSFQAFEEKLRADGAPQILIRNFSRQIRRLKQGQTGRIPLATIDPVQELPSIESLERHRASGLKHLARAVLVKLNGGLGTGMGLEKAKSLIPVKDGLTFLDIIARQVLLLRKESGADLPLLLMNSYSTEQDSLEQLARHDALAQGQSGIPLSFLQHRIPKVLADDLQPAIWPQAPEKEWCPPGHGDIYTALITTGVLDTLINRQFEFAFVSNSDNLGATLDARILGYMADKRIPFLMEVTDRTEADKKGGHLAREKSGRLILRELAQCPKQEEEDFQDIRKHRFFNTNNLWLNLRALAEYMRRNKGVMELPLIVNRKTVDPRDSASPAVIQIETAMGAAICVFDGAGALRVPRSRFSPVKTTDDLLAVRSDAYALTPESHIVLDPRRNNGPPVIKLDSKHYKMIDAFDARFPSGAPSLIACTSLHVEGEVTFGKGVTVRGRVHVKGPQTIPDNAVLE
jgi:UTP--glucose-1-phosphate uridylyltransferase